MYSSPLIEHLQNVPLTNQVISRYAELLRIPHFRGVFMRDYLPPVVNENETGVVNLDSINGRGTHWVCYSKRGYEVEYFDSFGNLRPPLELQNYFNSGSHRVVIRYNYFPRQNENTVNCGHLCLDFLARRRVGGGGG